MRFANSLLRLTAEVTAITPSGALTRASSPIEGAVTPSSQIGFSTRAWLTDAEGNATLVTPPLEKGR